MRILKQGTCTKQAQKQPVITYIIDYSINSLLCVCACHASRCVKGAKFYTIIDLFKLLLRTLGFVLVRVILER